MNDRIPVDKYTTPYDSSENDRYFSSQRYMSFKRSEEGLNRTSRPTYDQVQERGYKTTEHSYKHEARHRRDSNKRRNVNQESGFHRHLENSPQQDGVVERWRGELSEDSSVVDGDNEPDRWQMDS